MKDAKRVAKLLGWSGPMEGEDHPYAFDADANLSRELIAFVKTRGKWFRFIEELDGIISAAPDTFEFAWDILNATPAQVLQAFVATFSNDLAKLGD